MSKPFATQTLKPARKVKVEMRADLRRAIELMKSVALRDVDATPDRRLNVASAIVSAEAAITDLYMH